MTILLFLDLYQLIGQSLFARDTIMILDIDHFDVLYTVCCLV